jgi:hypothetical protein
MVIMTRHRRVYQTTLVADVGPVLKANVAHAIPIRDKGLV